MLAEECTSTRLMETADYRPGMAYNDSMVHDITDTLERADRNTRCMATSTSSDTSHESSLAFKIHLSRTARGVSHNKAYASRFLIAVLHGIEFATRHVLERGNENLRKRSVWSKIPRANDKLRNDHENRQQHHRDTETRGAAL